MAGATSSTTATTTTVTTTSTKTTETTLEPATCDEPELDRCTAQCLRRIDSLRKNYERCESSCQGDGCAEAICKRTARNIACLAIKARCSNNGDNIDFVFKSCCGRACPDVDEEVCEVLPTTTSTTRLPTTTAPTTTSSTSSTTIAGSTGRP